MSLVPNVGKNADGGRQHAVAELTQLLQPVAIQVHRQRAAQLALRLGLADQRVEWSHAFLVRLHALQRHGCDQHQAAHGGWRLPGHQFGHLRAHAVPHEHDGLIQRQDLARYVIDEESVAGGRAFAETLPMPGRSTHRAPAARGPRAAIRSSHAAAPSRKPWTKWSHCKELGHAK
jgi:hypothetical protein